MGLHLAIPFFKNFIRRKRVVTAYICYNRYILIVRKDDLFEKKVKLIFRFPITRLI
jgi:hypothetical protein